MFLVEITHVLKDKKSYHTLNYNKQIYFNLHSVFKFNEQFSLLCYIMFNKHFCDSLGEIKL